MMRLDHNRAVSQLAQKVGVPVTSVKHMTIWGNHSTTQYPDLKHCEVDGKQRLRRSSAITPGSRRRSSRLSPSAAPR